MLPAEYRLKHEKDIKTLFARGRSVFGIVVGMKYRSNKLDNTRFAIVVGTKVSKKAVLRNRFKRQIRAIIHEELANINPGYDVLIFAKKEIIGKPIDEIRKDVLNSLKKAKII